MAKKLITEADIVAAAARGVRIIAVDAHTIITPSARDAAARLRIPFDSQHTPSSGSSFVQSVTLHRPSGKKSKATVAIGADHGGYAMKEQIKARLLELGYSVADAGTNSEQPCDYPDFAYAVASLVASGEVAKGVMIDSVGVASAIVCNKVPGIRAVAAYNEFVARSSREHNDANVLTFGAKVLGIEAARSILAVWLETWFGGGRHVARVNKITDIEQRFSKRK